MRIATTIVLLAAMVLSVLVPAAPVRAEDDLQPKLRAALVKLTITRQSWDQGSPWNKARPNTSQQKGVAVYKGMVLTPASGLADHLMIEVSEANSARRFPASLVHIDYAANLALVKIDDLDLAERSAPLPLGEPITIDDEFEVWQIGDSNLIERATGHVQKVSASAARLQLTIKTTLSDSGNGQIVLRDGKLLGLVTYVRASRQEGTVLSLETIKHFLTDYDEGEYRGFGSGGIWTHRLLRDDLRAWYGVPEDAHGVGISHVVPGRTGHGALEARDVITHIDGHDLDDEGMFKHPVHGRLSMDYLLLGRTHPGDKVPAMVLRGGEARALEIPIRGWPFEEQLVPMNTVDRRPPYMVVGGMVILELTRTSRPVSQLLGQYQNRGTWDPPGERKRITYVSQVFSDDSNKGLDDIRRVLIDTVNGKKIGEMKDIVTALESPVDGFHIFTFEDVQSPFVIKADELDKINERIAKRYKIPEMSYFGED